MFTLAKATIASGALICGAANVDPVSIIISVANVSANQASTAFVFAPEHKAPDSFIRDGSDIEAIVEQTAEHFDNFAMQMPGVLGKKLKYVIKQ
jgi:hypothetical protein